MELLGLGAVDREVVFELVNALDPSANTLRGILDRVREIGARDGKELREVLASPKISRILREEGLARKERQKKLRDALDAERFPERDKIQERLDECRRELTKACGAQVTLPDNLEGDEVTITLRVRSPEDLSERANRLERAAHHPLLDELFSVLRGQWK